MSVFSGPVQRERVYPLVEKGEYVFTLLDLTFEEGGTYGDALLWKWMLAERETPTEYLARDDGNEKVIHEYTTPDIIVGSKPHEWIAALTGVVLEDGQEPPDSDDLINKRMLAYLTHLAPKKGPNAGKLKERIAQGSAKPFKLPSSRKSAPTQVSADPSVSEVDRALVVTKLQKQVAKLSKLNAEAGAAAQVGLDASDLETAPLADLERLLSDVTVAVASALDD